MKMKTVYYLLLLLSLAACNKKSELKKSKYEVKLESVLLVADLNLSYHEPSEITIEINDSVKTATLLIILNPIEIPKGQSSTSKFDTLYYKSVTLSDAQVAKLDSQVIWKINSGIKNDTTSESEGINISYLLSINNKLTHYSLMNPDSNKNPEALKLTQNFIENIRGIFNDTIINEYLDDVDSYIDKDKTKSEHSVDRQIDKLRKEKAASVKPK